MNIFLFDPLDVQAQARAHCDAHVVKMQLEITQMLSTVLKLNYNIDVPKLHEGFYKPTHRNHPCTKWLELDYVNFNYGMKYLKSLIHEYESRYKKLSSFRKQYSFINNQFDCQSQQLPESFVLAIKDEYLFQIFNDIPDKKNVSAATAKFAYQNYMRIAKSHFATWRYSERPIFMYYDIGPQMVRH